MKCLLSSWDIKVLAPVNLTEIKVKESVSTSDMDHNENKKDAKYNNACPV